MFRMLTQQWGGQDTFTDVLGARMLRGHVPETQSWLDQGLGTWGKEWAAAARSTDTLLWLSLDEPRQLGAEVDELLDRWSRQPRESRASARQEASPAARGDRVAVFAFFNAFPFDDQDVSEAALPDEAAGRSANGDQE